jgi:hypothetical protein
MGRSERKETLVSGGFGYSVNLGKLEIFADLMGLLVMTLTSVPYPWTGGA